MKRTLFLVRDPAERPAPQRDGDATVVTESNQWRRDGEPLDNQQLVELIFQFDHVVVW